MAAGGHWWWVWHMTWHGDKAEGVPVRKDWGGELKEGGQDASGVRAQFTRAALTPAGTTQGHRRQELVYTFSEEMTLIKKVPTRTGPRCAPSACYPC